MLHMTVCDCTVAAASSRPADCLGRAPIACLHPPVLQYRRRNCHGPSKFVDTASRSPPTYSPCREDAANDFTSGRLTGSRGGCRGASSAGKGSVRGEGTSGGRAEAPRRRGVISLVRQILCCCWSLRLSLLRIFSWHFCIAPLLAVCRMYMLPTPSASALQGFVT